MRGALGMCTLSHVIGVNLVLAFGLNRTGLLALVCADWGRKEMRKPSYLAPVFP